MPGLCVFEGTSRPTCPLAASATLGSGNVPWTSSHRMAATLTDAFAELLERNAVPAAVTAFATCLAVLDNFVADATKVPP